MRCLIAIVVLAIFGGCFFDGCTCPQAIHPQESIVVPPTKGIGLLAEQHWIKAPYAIRGVSFSPSGNRFLSGWMSDVARIWNIESGQELLRFETTGLPQVDAGSSWACPFGATLSADGKFALTGSLTRISHLRDFESPPTNNAYLWDAATGKLLKTLQGHTGRVLKVAFSNGSKLAITASWDGTARVWDVKTGTTKTVFGSIGKTSLESLAVSPDGVWVATGDAGRVVVWDTDSGEIRKTYQFASGGSVLDLKFSPDGRKLAACGVSDYISIWDLSNDSCIHLKREIHPIWAIAYTKDGKYLISSGTEDSGPHCAIWVTNTETWEDAFASPVIHGRIFTLAISADEKFIVSGGVDGLRTWQFEHR